MPKTGNVIVAYVASESVGGADSAVVERFSVESTDRDVQLRKRAIVIAQLMPEAEEDVERVMELLREILAWKYRKEPLLNPLR